MYVCCLVNGQMQRETDRVVRSGFLFKGLSDTILGWMDGYRTYEHEHI